MSGKIIFKIDKELDFKNHLIGVKMIKDNFKNMSPSIVEYIKLLKNTDYENKIKVFDNKTLKFYSNNMYDIRIMLVKQTQEMWNLIEKKYLDKMEKIYKKETPFKNIYGVLSTTPLVYGYDFNRNNPWFACPSDSPIKAIHVAMHEIMHSYFHKYFMEKYKNTFKLTDEQIWTIKEALTVILDLELSDIRMFEDKGKSGHERLRKKIKKDWLKYKNIENVLDKACLYIKKDF